MRNSDYYIVEIEDNIGTMTKKYMVCHTQEYLKSVLNQWKRFYEQTDRIFDPSEIFHSVTVHHVTSVEEVD